MFLTSRIVLTLCLSSLCGTVAPSCLSISHSGLHMIPRSKLFPSIDLPAPTSVPLAYGLAQRFCGEAGVKLAKVNKVFLTGTGAEEHAGLSGLILTLSALGSPVLEVFGPAGVDKLAVSDT